MTDPDYTGANEKLRKPQKEKPPIIGGTNMKRRYTDTELYEMSCFAIELADQHERGH